MRESTYDEAGGDQIGGYLPGVALTGTNTFSFCGANRNLVNLTADVAYTNRAPHDVTFTFDSNSARRTVRLGDTLYIAAGELLQYDGVQLTEVGFHIYPWNLNVNATGTGSMANGEYVYKICNKWRNGVGESEESTTATVQATTVSGGPGGCIIPAPPSCFVTHKPNIQVEVYRTQANPTADDPFYLASSNDPSVTSNPNRYLTNTTSTASPIPQFNDALADTSLEGLQTNSENGAILENLAPPASSIIFSTVDRIFLAGIAGQPDTVWYSKLRTPGTVAAFHDDLTFDVPTDGGDITAVAVISSGIQTIIVFRESAIYSFPGVGLDNSGNGTNYGPANYIFYRHRRG